MGYRDDFYSAVNIIGYSGQLHNFPTVYFQTNAEYGHITQKHGTSQNVGRMSVASAVGYVIANEMIHGQMKLVERINNNVIHESRSTLTAVGTYDFQTLHILSQSIRNYPDEKYISDYTEEDFDAIDDTVNRMRTVLGLPPL